MMGDREHLNDAGRLAKNQSVRELLEPEAADVGSTLNGISMWSAGDDLKSPLNLSDITGTETHSLQFVVSDLVQMLGLGSRMKSVDHLRRAWAFWETTSPGTNCTVP